MPTATIRLIAASLTVLAIGACSTLDSRPATIPSTDVNPITGSRGGR